MNLASLLQLLEELYSLNISFEICHPLLYRIRPLRLDMKQYQHHSPFCQYYKSRDGSLSCYENKSRIIRKVRDGKCRESVCSYGICEYTLPILRNGLLLGVFFFGTFIREEKKVRLPPGIEMPARMTPEIRKKLRQAASLIQDYVHLEISRSGMAELLNERTHSEQFYLENCRDFMEQHVQENIALADLAEQLGVNVNDPGGLLHRLQKESSPGAADPEKTSRGKGVADHTLRLFHLGCRVRMRLSGQQLFFHGLPPGIRDHSDGVPEKTARQGSAESFPLSAARNQMTELPRFRPSLQHLRTGIPRFIGGQKREKDFCFGCSPLSLSETVPGIGTGSCRKDA